MTLRKIFGVLLMVVGLGVALICVAGIGLFMGGTMIGRPASYHASHSDEDILFPLVIGGIPFAIGIGLFLAGRYLARDKTAGKGPPSPMQQQLGDVAMSALKELEATRVFIADEVRRTPSNGYAMLLLGDLLRQWTLPVFALALLGALAFAFRFHRLHHLDEYLFPIVLCGIFAAAGAAVLPRWGRDIMGAAPPVPQWAHYIARLKEILGAVAMLLGGGVAAWYGGIMALAVMPAGTLDVSAVTANVSIQAELILSGPLVAWGIAVCFCGRRLYLSGKGEAPPTSPA